MKKGFAHLLLVLFVLFLFALAFAARKGIFAGDVTPTGVFETVNTRTCTIRGWAIDLDTPEKSVQLHVYRDGPAGTGTRVGEYTANVKREDVNKSTGYKGDHGFEITFADKTEIKNSQSHKIYVYAINTTKGGKNSLISSSPRDMHCEVFDACSLTSDKFKFNVNLTTADGKSRLNLDGVKVKIDLTDDAKANLIKGNVCIPGDLPRTSAVNSGVVAFESLPIRNYNVSILTETLPSGYKLTSGEATTKLLTPAIAPNPVDPQSSQIPIVTFKISQSK